MLALLTALLALLVGAGAASAERAAGRAVKCDDPVSNATATQLKQALLDDLPASRRVAKVRGPLRSAGLWVCSLGSTSYAKATFGLRDGQATIRFQREGRRGNWHARVKTNQAYEPIPCEVRRAFEEVERC